MKSQKDFFTDNDCIVKVETFAEDFFNKIGVKDKMCANVKLSLVEALENSISHGNKRDPNKKVNVLLQSDGKELSIQITDMGEGFNHERIKSPILPENIKKLHGRGVFILNHLSDKLEYNELGNEIKISFNLK
jgi:serine/threonine-protein kinase RsbW